MIAPPAVLTMEGVEYRDGSDFWYAMEPAEDTGFFQVFVPVLKTEKPIPAGYVPVSAAENPFMTGLYNKFLVTFPAFERVPKHRWEDRR